MLFITIFDVTNCLGIILRITVYTAWKSYLLDYPTNLEKSKLVWMQSSYPVQYCGFISWLLFQQKPTKFHSNCYSHIEDILKNQKSEMKQERTDIDTELVIFIKLIAHVFRIIPLNFDYSKSKYHSIVIMNENSL